MSWKRMDFGIPTKDSAERTLDECRREFPADKFKVTQNKTGYSILIWVSPKPRILAVDMPVTKECQNPDSFGEICIQCNTCGRFS